MKTRLTDPYRLAPWLTMLLALLTYWATAEEGVSLWDCPEYVINAYWLDPGHPPGNPTWMLFHHVVTAPFPPHMAARIINLVSGIFMSAGAALLCSVLLTTLRVLRRGRIHDAPARWRLALAAMAGALTFAWCDSAWFSAVEAEVYAMSLFLTALCVWLMTGWCFMPPGPARLRRLVLIAYLTGLSLGVHQLNLLCIPALALIWVFARNQRRGCTLRGWIALGAGALLVGAVLAVFMPLANRWAQICDLWGVNHAGWAPGYGWALAVVTGLAVVLALPLLLRGTSWRTAAWMGGLFCVGYCVWLIIPIRAAAGPVMNEGNPSDPFSFAAYQGRDQYGSTPLLRGRTPLSRPLVRHENRSMNALRETGPYIRLTEAGYDTAGYRRDYLYPPELDMWFPRMTSTDPADMDSYRAWSGMSRDDMVPVRASSAIDSAGRLHDRYVSARPSYMHQLRYFAAYQSGYMYFRYLLWNYLGRQNDLPSTGETDHGNFVTGLDFIDDAMLGPQSLLPPEARRDNRGRNLYFGLPLLLGLSGLVWLCCRRGRVSRRIAAVTGVLFLLTGLAIVVYLNQSPGEPRERDYSFLGSFWVFSLWIGVALGALVSARRKRVRALGAALCMIVPLMMWMVNYDDHDRTGRRVPETLAADILNQLPPHAIIVVNGDNIIFPLWYAQQMLGMRRDVTVVAEPFLNSAWYLISLKRTLPGSSVLQLCADAEALTARQPWRAMLPDTVSATMAGDRALMLMYGDTAQVRRLPARILTVDTPDGTREIDLIGMAGCRAGHEIPIWKIALLDIVISNPDRPVYWHLLCSDHAYGGLRSATSPWSLGRRLTLAGDTLPSTAEWQAWLAAMPGNHIDSAAYVDPYSGYMIGLERRGLLNLANALEAEGRGAEAARMARHILTRIPGSVWPMDPYTERGEVHYPHVDLIRMLETYGSPADRRLADSLRRAETDRAEAWTRMLRAYPPADRPRLSPRARNQGAAAAHLRDTR